MKEIVYCVLFVLVFILIIIEILRYCKYKTQEIKQKEENVKELIERCASCKNCKMLYEDGSVVCEKLNYKTPYEIPDRCYKSEMKGLPPVPFDELDEIEVDEEN